MVTYDIANDPSSLPLGTYFVRTNVITRGANAGKKNSMLFQVRKRADGEHYWHRVKNPVGGRPPQLSSRHLDLTPSDEVKAAYAKNDVYLHAAYDNAGTNPTSHFILRRRKEGDEYAYYWSSLKPKVESSPGVRKPASKAKKAGKVGAKAS